MGSVGSDIINNALSKIHSLEQADNELVNPLFDSNDPNLIRVEIIDRDVENNQGVYAQINVSDLKSVQKNLAKSNLEYIIKSYEQLSGPIDVIAYGGKYYIMNGNHRGVAAALLNKKKIQARILNRRR